MHQDQVLPDLGDGHLDEGNGVVTLDARAIEEGRRSAHERSHIGALTHEPGDQETNKPVTREMVAVRLAVLEETRTRVLDELAVIEGKILGLREILASSGERISSP